MVDLIPYFIPPPLEVFIGNILHRLMVLRGHILAMISSFFKSLASYHEIVQPISIVFHYLT
jgi:hypothetical protein